MFFTRALILAIIPIFALVQATPVADSPEPADSVDSADLADSSQASITRTGRTTFYNPGLGACGTTNTDASMVAAMNAPTFNNYPGAGTNPNTNPICGKKVTVKYKGKSVVVKVVDKCPTCGPDAIDLSPSAFKKLAPLSVGHIRATWTLPK